jgi:hypothetical protein
MEELNGVFYISKPTELRQTDVLESRIWFNNTPSGEF